MRSLVTALCIAYMAAFAHATPPKYIATPVVDFPEVNLSSGFRARLNDSGLWINNLRGGPGDGFYYHVASRTVDSYTDLGTLPGGYPQAFGYDINDAGYVVGTAYKSQVYLSGTRDAFVFSPGGQKTKLPRLNHGAHASAITENSSVIAGTSFLDAAGNIARAVYWKKENGSWTVHNLGVVGNHTDSRAFDVNSSGQVLGSSYTDLGNFQSATDSIIWEPNQAPIILPDDFSPISINDMGYVLGGGAKLWMPDTGVQQLPLGNAQYLNNVGQIVGADGGLAVLWEDGQAYFLNDLLMDDSVSLPYAYAISDSGLILAASDTDVYLLTPAPEPATAAMLAMSVVVATLRRSRHHAIQTT